MSFLKGFRRSAIVGATCVLLGATGCCGVSSTGSCLRSRTIRMAASEGDTARLAEWLGDERSWVREEAALAAGRHRRRTVLPRVRARLLDANEKPWVRAAAARAVGDLGTTDADTLTSLALAVETPSSVKLALIETICRVDRDAGASRLDPLKNDPDLLVAASAERKVQTRCAPSK